MKHSLDKRRRPKRRPVAFEPLEPRLLLSADLAPALAPFAHDALPPIPAEHRSLEALAELPRVVMAQEAARASELVFVDATLPDYERLVADVLRSTGGERPVEVILLDPSRDGVAQMTEALASRTELAAVHLVTHGGDGRLQLGDATLDAAALAANSDAIAGWSRAFAADGDLLLYGCNVAETARGGAFIDALALLTGADVAASDDRTGAARLGGDWDLERTTGLIEVTMLPLTNAEWDGLLVAQTLDWDNPAVDWPAAGLGPTSFAVGGGNVTITVSDPAGRLNNGSPDDATNDQGGLAVTEQGLYISSTGFLAGESTVITIDFSHPGGVSNVSFTIFDIDRGGGPNFIDEVQASYTASGPVTLGIATGPNNILVAPDTVQGTQATTSNGPNSSDANATFTFTGTRITQIKLNYRNAGGATNQSITLHDINFTENSRPSGTDGAAVVNEDTTYSFAAATFGFTDPDAGDMLSAVRIDSLPGAGTFVLIGSGAVTTGQVITVADINAGNLRFTPVANANGAVYATFTFSVRDSGGLFNASPNTLNITVNALNDAPVGSGSATLGAVAEDAASPAGATVSALFGTNYSDAADGAGATALAGVAIVGNTATAAQGVWQYSPDGLAWTTIGAVLFDASAVTLPATHLVRFLPAADFNGTPGALSVRLADGSAGAIAVATEVNLGGAVGGTGNWSVATVALGTSITAVNDAPTFGALGNQTVAEDAAAQTLAGFTTVAPGGGADEAGQTFSYAVINDNNALFTVQPTIAANGTLTYTSAPNANGAATVTVTLSDSGGTANGGDDTAPAQTFSINVNAVADAPSLMVNPAVGNEDTAIPLSIAHALADNDGSETLALTVSAIPVGATLSDGVNAFTAIAGNQSVAITTWNLAQLQIAAPLHSDVDFTLVVSATATETANGATATTNANLAVTVNAVADTPTLTVNAASGNEDTAIPLSAAAALVDTDGSEALAVTVAGIPVGAILSDGTNLFTATAGNQSVAVTGWNLALLRVTPPLDADTNFTLAVTATATEALGGSAASAIANLAVDVVPVNDAPTIAAPPAMTAVEDVASPVTGIVIGDVDGTAGPVSVTLSVPSGTLAATSGAGVLVAGSGTGALALVGTTTAINAFLAAGSVTFTTALDATAPVPLSAFVNDLGNFGAGGPLLSPTIGVTLNVTAVNDAPVLGPVALSIDPLQTVTMTGGNMSATDVDNPAASLAFLVAGATNGQFELAAAPGVPVTSFTQAQLASGAVRFAHANAGFGPSFSIFVTDGAAIAGPGVAVVSFRAPGGEPPAPAKQPDPVRAPVEAGSDVLATGRSGLPEPTASDFVRTPFAPSGTAAVTFAEAPAETAIVLAQPVRVAALLDLRASGAPGDGFVEADRIPTGVPKMNFAIDTMRHDEAPHSFDVAFDSARITGMALSVGAVWWAARAGGLLASLLASTPAWRHVDPLPVLGRDDDEPEIDWNTPDKNPPEEDASEAAVFDEGRAANDRR